MSLLNVYDGGGCGTYTMASHVFDRESALEKIARRGFFLVHCVLKVGEEAQTFAMRRETTPTPPQAGLSAVVWVQERVCYY